MISYPHHVPAGQCLLIPIRSHYLDFLQLLDIGIWHVFQEKTGMYDYNYSHTYLFTPENVPYPYDSGGP